MDVFFNGFKQILISSSNITTAFTYTFNIGGYSFNIFTFFCVGSLLIILAFRVAKFVFGGWL